MPRWVDGQQRLTVYFGEREVFSREVDSFTCEEELTGKFTAEASFTPIKADWDCRG